MPRAIEVSGRGPISLFCGFALLAVACDGADGDPAGGVDARGGAEGASDTSPTADGSAAPDLRPAADLRGVSDADTDGPVDADPSLPADLAALGDGPIGLDVAPPSDMGLEADAAPRECETGEQRPCPDPACAAGRQTCDNAGRWAACAGTGEICDGLDNNCDGATDEGFSLGDACENGLGLCTSHGVRVCDPADGRATVCDAVPGAPGPELCDGLDNDCDGRVDADLQGPLSEACYDGPEDTAGIGNCHGGRARCDGGAFGLCEGWQGPVDETCNGLDDDCDGVPDEDAQGQPIVAVCYGGPIETLNVGLCRGGLQRCALGALGACEGEIQPAVEICDLQDNDCNGLVDDVAPEVSCRCVPGTVQACYTGPEGTQGVGTCHEGTQVCGADARLGPCIGEQGVTAELCDGLDNDCNQRADDGVVGAGAPCSVGLGACAGRGLTFCDPAVGALACGALPLDPEPEVCNALDDDCDGVADEGLGLDDPCSAGNGACELGGHMICDRNGGTTCDAVPPPGIPELCDGIDNDCDGTIDDGLHLGESCTAGTGACAMDGQLVCAPGGQVACSAGGGNPSPEICDGLDNDCDGAIDEDDPEGGAECATGELGACSPGLTACIGHLLVCQRLAEPTDEACDGLDNDCDGGIDEGVDGAALARACYSGPPGTAEVGACSAGSQLCEGGAFGGCAAEVLPALEICDSADNDCNGAVDDLPGGVRCACAPGSARDCFTGTPDTLGVGLCHGGRQTCAGDGLSYGACVGEQVAVAELCDGQDNDCDGRADDEVEGTGAPCAAGIGACRSLGVTYCDGNADRVLCGAVAGAPQPESCDQIDNDCDGQVDNGLDLGQACSVGVGACRAGGRTICDGAGGVTCSVRAGNPVAEVCDDVDNDCDGETDEGFDLGVACQVGTGACQRGGVNVCAAGGGATCSAVAGEPVAEACNGLDDDCDGMPDDGDPGSGQPCATGAPGVCAAGATHCDNARIVCIQAIQPTGEACDGLDNDCDDARDEAADGTPLNQGCYTGPAGTNGIGACHAGTTTCENAVFGACSGQVTPAAAEACDGRDDNCNGSVDEGFPLGQACNSGVGVCRRAGVYVCGAGGALLCSAVAGSPGAEVCNGLDDDCDGLTDDGLSCLSVYVADNHSCALMHGGTLKCWGTNRHGDLGLGDVAARGDGANEMGASLPAVNLGAGRTVTQLAAGGDHHCAILDSGVVKCWGYNGNGELGQGNTMTRGDAVGEMGDALAVTPLGAGRTAVAIKAGYDHTCAILDNQTLKCWGWNGYGELGQGGFGSRGDAAGEMGDALPAIALGTGRTPIAVSLGYNHTCALLDNHAVKCWGRNSRGQLGLGDLSGRGDAGGEMGDSLPSVDLGVGRTAVEIGTGSHFTCARLDNGSVKCWGDNAYGQLGQGDITARGDGPGEMGDALPAINLGTGRTARALSVGSRFACALLDDASLKCWGANESGQLGQGHTGALGDQAGEMGDALPTVPLGTGRTAASVSASIGAIDFSSNAGHICAVLDDQSLKCWGLNSNGQLGLGNVSSRGDAAGEMGDALPAVVLE